MNTRLLSQKALAIASLLCVAGSVRAMPAKLGYTGRLYDANGSPINGSVDIKVTFYSGAGAVGDPLVLMEESAVDGYITLRLDATEELIAVLSDPAAEAVALSFEVRMHADDDSAYQLLTPPQPLMPVPWALATAQGSGAGAVPTWVPDTNTLTISDQGSEHSTTIGPFNAPLTVDTAIVNNLAVTSMTAADANGSNFPHSCTWHYNQTTGTESWISFHCPEGTYAFSGSCRTDGGARLTDCGGFGAETWTYVSGPPTNSHGWLGWWDTAADPTLDSANRPSWPPGSSKMHSVQVLCCRY